MYHSLFSPSTFSCINTRFSFTFVSNILLYWCFGALIISDAGFGGGMFSLSMFSYRKEKNKRKSYKIICAKAECYKTPNEKTQSPLYMENYSFCCFDFACKKLAWIRTGSNQKKNIRAYARTLASFGDPNQSRMIQNDAERS